MSRLRFVACVLAPCCLLRPAAALFATDGKFHYWVDPNHLEFEVPCVNFSSAEERARMEDYVRRNWDDCSYAPPPNGLELGCHNTYQQPRSGRGGHGRDCGAERQARAAAVFDRRQERGLAPGQGRSAARPDSQRHLAVRCGVTSPWLCRRWQEFAWHARCRPGRPW